MNLDSILSEIDHEISRLQQAKQLLMDNSAAANPVVRRGPGRPPASSTATQTKSAGTSVSGRRTMSAAGRARIAAAQKARWAKAKKAAKKSSAPSTVKKATAKRAVKAAPKKATKAAEKKSAVAKAESASTPAA